jgi:triosephosphate isomerase (TIM)
LSAFHNDISPFDEGAYTGEINGNQIREFADYVIIGHSERRKNFAETDEMLSQKVQRAIECSLTPIFCVQGSDTPIPDGVTLVAYEPIFAIGTGNPDTPENAEAVIKTIKEKNPSVKYVLYGGSVTPEGVGGFTQKPLIDGVLVGGASLLSDKFVQIIKNS